MTTNRREFIERIGATAFLGALPISSLAAMTEPGAEPVASPSNPAEWDFQWVEALKGKKHRGLFDCTEVESGYGVWRASIWENQYQAALSADRADIATVLILRHNAVVLALRQSFWDAQGIGAVEKVTHPITMQSTDRNPALLDAAGGVPQPFDAFALPRFIARGGIVLACDLALDFFAGKWSASAGVAAPEIKQRAVAALVPGVVLMPSGVFAAVKAQEEGCHYVKAS